jgi:hypothetical protein
VRQRLQQSPDQHIPELQLLTERNWFETVKDLKQLDTDEDFKRAFSEARNSAKGEFGELLRKGLRSFAEATAANCPRSLRNSQPYFEKTVDESVFQRYHLLQTGQTQRSFREMPTWLPKLPHQLIETMMPSFSSRSMEPTRALAVPLMASLKTAGMKFAAANNGLLPTDPAQLTPYLQEPVDPAKIKQVLSKIPPGVNDSSAIGGCPRR